MRAVSVIWRRNAFQRAGLHAALLALLCAVAACKSGEQKADALEARYDRQMGNQRFPQALKSIQEAVQEDEDEPRRWLKLAQVQDILNRPAAAAMSYQHALDLQPDNVTALENLAILSVRGGQFDTAKRYVDPLLLLQPSSLAGLLASGAIALHERRFADVARISDQLVQLVPDRSEGYVLKARALDMQGKSREAIASMEDRVRIDPDNRDLLIQLMSLYRKMRDRDGIRRTAIRLMPLVPDDPRYAMESARAYHGEGRDDQADRIIADLQEKYARNGDMMRAIGEYWRDTLPPAQARARIAAAGAQALPRVRTRLADLLIEMGDPEHAIGLLGSLAPAKVATYNIDSQTHYARALFDLGRFAAAKAKSDAVLAFDASNPEALLVRARLEMQRNDLDAAVTDAQFVANDDDTNEEAALLVAEIYARQGKQLLAAGAYGSARQKFPDSLNALRAETSWLLAQGRKGEAVDHISSFVHAKPRPADGWALFRDTCAAAGNAACLAEANRVLAGLNR